MSLTPFKLYNKTPSPICPLLGTPHPDWHHPVHVPHTPHTPIIYSNHLLTPNDDRSPISIAILYPTLITPRPLERPPRDVPRPFIDPIVSFIHKTVMGVQFGLCQYTISIIAELDTSKGKSARLFEVINIPNLFCWDFLNGLN